MIKKNFKTYNIMESYNIIKILPNIYLTNNYNIDNNFLINNSITHIIVINNIYENNIEQSETYTQINLSVSELNIDFNVINIMLIDILKKAKNILIISEKNIVGFIIVGAFLISNLNLSFLQILIMDKYYDIQIKKSKYYKLLENYYNNKKNILL